MASTVINGQTCLEKRGIVERGKELDRNLYKNITLDEEYSISHQNAQSTPDAPGAEGMKGKSTGGGGHLYFQGYYGKPRGTENVINYSNFTTFEDAGVTIGNRADVDKRKELYLTRRYNRDEGSYYTSSHPDAMSNGDIIGKGTGIELDTTNGGGAYDVRLRTEHLEQNVWKKDVIEYTKPLVLAEYQIQTEFKISTHDEEVKERQERIAAEKAAKEEKKALKEANKAVKAAEKARRRQEKSDKKINKTYLDGVPDNGQPGDYERQPRTQYSPSANEGILMG